MALSSTGLRLGNATSSAQVTQALEDMVTTYNMHPDVKAYAENVPLRKRRKASSGGIQKDNDTSGGLDISRRRVLAMKAFLQGSTWPTWMAIQEHLCVVGDYRISALSDEILSSKFLYVDSVLSKEHLPSDAELVAREAFADHAAQVIGDRVWQATYQRTAHHPSP